MYFDDQQPVAVLSARRAGAPEIKFDAIFAGLRFTDCCVTPVHMHAKVMLKS